MAKDETETENKPVPLIKNGTKEMYMRLSAAGQFDIHLLKTRDPKMYKEIMGE